MAYQMSVYTADSRPLTGHDLAQSAREAGWSLLWPDQQPECRPMTLSGPILAQPSWSLSLEAANWDQATRCELIVEPDIAPDALMNYIVIYETAGLDCRHIRALRESRAAYHITHDGWDTTFPEWLSQTLAQLRGGLWIDPHTNRWAIIAPGDPLVPFVPPLEDSEPDWLLGLQ